jgi:hypothetical protein
MKFMKTRMRALYFGMVVALFAFMFVFVFFRGEIAMMLNPKYDEKNLLGLTSSQVIQKLGPPSYDSREHPIPSEQMWFAYEYAGVSRTIQFKNDKVDSVWWNRK